MRARTLWLGCRREPTRGGVDNGARGSKSKHTRNKGTRLRSSSRGVELFEIGWVGGVYYCDVCELNIWIKVEFYSQKKRIYLAHNGTRWSRSSAATFYFLFCFCVCVAVACLGPVVLYRLSRYIAYQCYSDG